MKIPLLEGKKTGSISVDSFLFILEEIVLIFHTPDIFPC